MHLRCPHCQSPIELADVPSASEITCVGCGSTFQLDNFATATFAGASDASPTRQRIGKFEVLGPLGQGAFGTVVKAHDTELDRIVAIKIPRSGNVGPRPHDVDRFLREARSVAQLRFPSIITIHEVGVDDGVPYLVCDYVEGVTLADLLIGRRPTFRESAKLLTEVADALQYAHSLGIVHRDVKPSNIMIRPDGSPCVMDFGLAKRDVGEITMTMDGQILGTPAYMSPEQARGEGHTVDGRSDVYSLGVMLYQLLTGELPFRGNKTMLLHQVLNDDPLGPRALNDKVPRDLETIALKAMAREPGRRYASAEAFADDLRHWLAGEPILARPVGTGERFWRWCRRKPALAAANAAVVVALITFVAAFFIVNASLEQEQIERGKAQVLARQKATLAQEKDDLARVEIGLRIKAEKLADANKQLALKEEKARHDAEDRRERAEQLALQAKFDKAYHRYAGDTRRSLVACSHLLAPMRRLKDRSLEQSLRLHLAAWREDAHPLRSIMVHDGKVMAVAFSPDSKRVVTASDGRTAQVWDSTTGKPIGKPLQHQGWVLAAAFSPDGACVATGSLDRTAQLWNSTTGEPLGPPIRHQAPVIAVAFNPDGKSLASGSYDGTVRIWHGTTGAPLGKPMQHRDQVIAVRYSSDGERLLTGSYDKTARLWHTATGEPATEPMQHQGKLASVAFSPDGKTIATASADKTAQLWDGATGKPLGSPLQHLFVVSNVAFSPDSKFVLTKSSSARLWDVATGNPLGPDLAPGAASVATLSPDGNNVLIGGFDGIVQLWNGTTGKSIGTPFHQRGTVAALAFSPDGKCLVTAGDDIRLWDSTIGKSPRAALPHEEAVLAIAFNPDGSRVVTGGSDKTARLWDAKTGEPVGRPMQHQDLVTALAFGPNGNLLTGSRDKTAQLWNGITGEPLGAALIHHDDVCAVAFSPDGKTLLTGSFDATARLWDRATGKPLGDPMRHRTRVVAVAFSPDGKRVLTGSYDATARLWDSATGRPLSDPLQHKNPVASVAFSPDSKIALTGSHDMSAQFWDSVTGKSLGIACRHQGAIFKVAFSPDGKSILTASGDKSARLWDAKTGKPLAPPLQHQGGIFAIAFSPNGDSVVTTSPDRTAQIWESATGKPFGAPLQHQGTVQNVAFSPDGKTVATASLDKSARLWKAPQPIHGDPERILLALQVATGLTADERGDVHVLDAAAWQQRRLHLQELGGPPVE